MPKRKRTAALGGETQQGHRSGRGSKSLRAARTARRSSVRRISSAIIGRPRNNPDAVPAPYLFTRSMPPEYLTLTQNQAETDWVDHSAETGQGISRAYSFSMGLLPNIDEFTALFKQYKLNGIEVTVTPCSTGVLNIGAPGSVTVSPSANNSLCRIVTQTLNFEGTAAEAMTSKYVSESQTCRIQILQHGKPLTFWVNPTEDMEVEGHSVAVAAVTKPRWHHLTVTGLDTKFSGLNMRIERVDGQGLGAGFATNQEQKCRIEQKFYFGARMVH